MTEPVTDKRTPEQKRAAIRHSIITWAVFIGGRLLFAAASLPAVGMIDPVCPE